MGKPVALVTGACGEMGQMLVPALAERGFDVVALDVAALPQETAARCREVVQASIVDSAKIEALFRVHGPEVVFHLAAILSTKAEREPDLATEVNLGGTFTLFRASRASATKAGRDVRFLFPSSIAVYGLPNRAAKDEAGAVREADWAKPIALYGIHKLQCEMAGEYFTRRARSSGQPGLDFRSIRFPGLLSPETVPSGGTSDYAPEMVHAAAQGRPYDCFVDAQTRLPFMSMRDAVGAFLALASAPAENLGRRVYNIRSFSASAEEFRQETLRAFPGARIGYAPEPARQAIVDSWPVDVDDSAARRDWGFRPGPGLRETLAAEFVPALQRRYSAKAAP